MARRILLVEGRDDEHVLKHICGIRGIPHLDEIAPLENVERLLSHIPTRLRATSEEGDVVGVVIDADTSVGSRWQAVRDRFIEAGYPNVPHQPNPNGTIFDRPNDSLLPRAGVWMMPDNKTHGILENFLRFLVPQPNALFDHVTKNVETIPARRFSQLDEPKAIIHTWLAWQEEPGKPFGTAITARFLDADVPEADVRPMFPKPMFPKPMFPKPMFPKPMFPKPMFPKPMFPKPMFPKPMFPKPMFPKPMSSLLG